MSTDISWLPRRYYVLALRDELPLPSHGWSVHVHLDECRAEQDAPACSVETCRGLHCRFTRFDGEEHGFSQAMADLAIVLQRITGSPNAMAPPSLPLPTSRAVLSVGGTFENEESLDEHFNRCFRLAQEATKALRIATQARIPNLTIERVWPAYFILTEDMPGAFKVHNLMIVEHGWAGTVEVTSQVLRRAEALFSGGWSQSPVELYRDFELGAQNAAAVAGDYPDATIKAAIAAEVLLKHTAWMLIWEATTELTKDPRPPASQLDPFAANTKLVQLISGVLTPRLGGNWSSQDERHPIGGWRTYIARRRSAVIHRGQRPTEQEIRTTIHALHVLEQHVLDRVAANAGVYPRTAMLMVGPSGLKRRNVSEKIKQAEGDRRTLPALSYAYSKWLDQQFEDDLDD